MSPTSRRHQERLVAISGELLSVPEVASLHLVSACCREVTPPVISAMISENWLGRVARRDEDRYYKVALTNQLDQRESSARNLYRL